MVAKRARHLESGFTLMEMVISMTLFALIAVVLYAGFNMAVQTWEKQDLASETERRMQTLARVLYDDFSTVRNYDFRWERGLFRFFAGNDTVLFYVTTSGFGARDDQDKGLFFSLAFLSEEDDGTWGLRIYKTPWLESSLAEELADFLSHTMEEAGFYEPSEAIHEKSILVMSGLSEAAFRYDQELSIEQQIALDEMEQQESQEEESDEMLESKAVEKNIPDLLGLEFLHGDSPVLIEVPTPRQPMDDHYKLFSELAAEAGGLV